LNNTKSFVIDHPLDPENKHLVHVCLEGPEAGVYYRGEARIEKDKKSVLVELPNYVSTLARDFTVHLTSIIDEEKEGEGEGEGEREGLHYYIYRSSKVIENKFRIHGPPGLVHWQVFGKRHEVETEPLKFMYEKRGDGPYTYLLPKT